MDVPRSHARVGKCGRPWNGYSHPEEQCGLIWGSQDRDGAHVLDSDLSAEKQL